jgi:hypothetical protein
MEWRRCVSSLIHWSSRCSWAVSPSVSHTSGAFVQVEKRIVEPRLLRATLSIEMATAISHDVPLFPSKSVFLCSYHLVYKWQNVVRHQWLMRLWWGVTLYCLVGEWRFGLNCRLHSHGRSDKCPGYVWRDTWIGKERVVVTAHQNRFLYPSRRSLWSMLRV